MKLSQNFTAHAYGFNIGEPDGRTADLNSALQQNSIFERSIAPQPLQTNTFTPDSI